MVFLKIVSLVLVSLGLVSAHHHRHFQIGHQNELNYPNAAYQEQPLQNQDSSNSPDDYRPQAAHHSHGHFTIGKHHGHHDFNNILEKKLKIAKDLQEKLHALECKAYKFKCNLGLHRFCKWYKNFCVPNIIPTTSAPTSQGTTPSVAPTTSAAPTTSTTTSAPTTVELTTTPAAKHATTEAAPTTVELTTTPAAKPTTTEAAPTTVKVTTTPSAKHTTTDAAPTTVKLTTTTEAAPTTPAEKPSATEAAPTTVSETSEGSGAPTTIEEPTTLTPTTLSVLE